MSGWGYFLLVLLAYLGLLYWSARRAPLVDPGLCPWPHLPGAGDDCGGPCAVEPPCMDQGVAP